MSPGELLAATAVIALGSVVQAASGVGAGFIIVPLVALINLALVPAPMIFASLALSGVMAWRERGAIDRAHVPLVLAGILPGSIAGAWILSSLPADRVGVVFGVVVLLGVGLTVSGLRIPLNRLSAVAAGAISGAMGTSSGIGAPVLAILYQGESGPRVRATLAFLYSGATVLILLVLAAFHKFGLREAATGSLLMPGFLAGYLAANRLRHHLDRSGRTRLMVLVVSAAAAAVLLGRSLWPLLG